MKNEDREERVLADRTYNAMQSTGRVMLWIGMGLGVLHALAPTVGLTPPAISWTVVFVFVALGIMLRFPKSDLAFSLAKRLDKLADKYIAPDTDGP